MTTTKDDASHDVIKADVLGRVKVKSETCERILDEFERSGISGRAFAKHHGIKEVWDMSRSARAEKVLEIVFILELKQVDGLLN